MRSIRHRIRSAGAALVMLALSGAAMAHHSFAMFDHDHQVRMTGKVKDFRWQNPHVYIELTAPDAKGEMRNFQLAQQLESMAQILIESILPPRLKLCVAI